MAEAVGRMQSQLKKTSGDLFLFSLKLISGAVLGLTFALVMQVILDSNESESVIAFVFMITVVTGLFVRLAKSWGLTTILVFDLVCVLVALLLRLYIMVAPES